MNADRIVVVGVVWTLFLIGLLVLREFVIVADRPSWRPILPLVRALAIVMLGAAGLAAALHLALLASRPMDPAGAGGPTPLASSVAVVPTGLPRASLASIVPASPSPKLSASPSPDRPSTPPPVPIVTPPSATQPPSSLAPETTRPAPTAATATVSAGPEFRAYDVEDGRVTGYRFISVEARITATASTATTYAFPSFSDPDGTIRLVRLQTGRFAGVFVSPDDAGIAYRGPG